MEARTLEELSFTCWPSLQTEFFDGWLLRYSGGGGRRVNSVQTLYPSFEQMPGKVEYAERFYAMRGQPCRFKITPASDSGLDQFLSDRGYRVCGETVVQVAHLSDYLFATDPAFSFTTTPEAAWFSDRQRLGQLSEDDLRTYQAIYERVAADCFFGSLRDGEQVMSVGVAILCRGSLGVQSVVTQSERRNRGYGRRLMQSLLAQGRTLSAQFAHLQVEEDNHPAIHLYESLGFRETYHYHYRERAA